MKQVLGIDRRIRRHWLDQLLDYLADNSDPDQIRDYVDQQLREELPAVTSRKNTVAILMRIWGTPVGHAAWMRERAIRMLRSISGHDRLWLHWGMTCLAYPFFRDTAEVVGRLLNLQDDFTGKNVQSRLTTAWGDRVTTQRAAGTVLRTLLDWDVLRAGRKQGQYLFVARTEAGTPELQLWLLEALLSAGSSDEVEAQQLLRLPEAFPFTFGVGVADLRRYSGVDVHRQGLDMEMVAVRPARRAVQVSAPEPDAPPKESAAQPKRRRHLLFAEIEDDTTDVAEAAEGFGSNARKPSVSEKRLARQMRREFRESVDERISRIIAAGPAMVGAVSQSGPLAECCRLYRDGYFTGCIALGRDVLRQQLTVLSRGKSKRQLKRQPPFDRVIATLRSKTHLPEDTLAAAHTIWEAAESVIQAGCHPDETEALATTMIQVLLAVQRASRD